MTTEVQRTKRPTLSKSRHRQTRSGP